VTNGRFGRLSLLDRGEGEGEESTSLLMGCRWPIDHPHLNPLPNKGEEVAAGLGRFCITMYEDGSLCERLMRKHYREASLDAR